MTSSHGVQGLVCLFTWFPIYLYIVSQVIKYRAMTRTCAGNENIYSWPHLRFYVSVWVLPGVLALTVIKIICRGEDILP